jgi:Zn-dependent protease
MLLYLDGKGKKNNLLTSLLFWYPEHDDMDRRTTLYTIPGVLLGLTVHECCHALCAWKLGDSTARDQGRITLNPLKHIDLVGFLFIVFAGFGWAKPVQFNPQYLSRPRRDKALIAAAGPLSNFVLGVLLTLNLKALIFSPIGPTDFTGHLFNILFYAAAINFGLFIFNLLPIPPLDGSHIAFSGLNLRPETERRIRQIGMPLLFAVILIQSFSGITIIPIGKFVGGMINFLLK